MDQHGYMLLILQIIFGTSSPLTAVLTYNAYTKEVFKTHEWCYRHSKEIFPFERLSLHLKEGWKIPEKQSNSYIINKRDKATARKKETPIDKQ